MGLLGNLIDLGISKIPYIGSFYTALKTVKGVAEITAAIQCAAQWTGYMMLVFAAVHMLADALGIIDDLDFNKLLNELGLGTLLGSVGSANAFNRKITSNMSALQPVLQKGTEYQTALNMAPSGLNGTHKPPYESIAIQEVLYQFSNTLGYGQMIIMFNPAGFGNKPKVPMIVNYVDEQEFAKFIESKSWGEYWRYNFLLRNRKDKKRRPRQQQTLVDDETTLQPAAESIDEFFERVLDLDDDGQNAIAGEFREQALEAADKAISQLDSMSRAIEKGNLGRGVEENGVRITSILQDKVRDIPNDLLHIVQTNPVFKDVAKVTAVYKKTLAKLRDARTLFSNALNLRSFSALSSAALSGLGRLGGSFSYLFSTNEQLFVSVASRVGEDVGLEGWRTFSGLNAEQVANATTRLEMIDRVWEVGSGTEPWELFSRDERKFFRDYYPDLGNFTDIQSEIAELWGAFGEEGVKIFESIMKGDVLFVRRKLKKLKKILNDFDEMVNPLVDGTVHLISDLGVGFDSILKGIPKGIFVPPKCNPVKLLRKGVNDVT